MNVSTLDSRGFRFRRLAHLALLAGAALWSLSASHAAWADVPGRVGRISFMQGDVQSYSETEPEWKVAYVNEPITSHNSIFVGDAGRAEISVGSTTLAMDAGAQVDVQQLDDNTFNANVIKGRVSLRVRRLDPNDVYNVAAPGAAIALLQPGRYRIDALDGSSGITVFAGTASVQNGEPLTVPAGSSMRLVVNPNDPNGAPQLAQGAAVPVPLDDWVVAREDRFRAPQAERYVSPNMTGYEDLDANGRWASEADVGPVWYPTTYVRADWAPYRYGRWAYVAPWGYTWIDDAPWGFAPFHYGRWLEVNGRWGWCPGAYIARPAFAPALVGFYGGNGFSASFSVGAGPAIGWYPLAPWERFTPHYAHGGGYINQVNNITIVNAPPRFAAEGGWNREHGATIVPRDAFASQRSISRVAIPAPRNAFERAAPVNVAELPRPSAVPGAVRRGPEGPGAAPRPDFRPPREFAAERAPQREGRPIEASRPQPGNAGIERGALSPNDRRPPEVGRPGVAADAPRPAANERVEERSAPVRGPSQPNFNREGRPVQQALPNADAAPHPMTPNADRIGPRNQAMQRGGDPEAAERARQQAAERQSREFRAPQPAPSAPAAVPPQRIQLNPRPQTVEVPPPAERPQRVERPQATERPQPVEQRQPVERPQRVERPQQTAPQPAVAPQPRPQPQARPTPQQGQGERGNERGQQAR